jgi:peroxiredoxin
MAATSTMLELGTEAPDFALNSTDERLVLLSDLKGAPATLVMFICNHCPYVVHVEKELGKLGKSYEKRGVAVVAICSNDTESHPDDGPDGLRDQAKRAGFTFPYLMDDTQEVAKAYRAACTPDFYVFDGDLRLAYRGQLDDSRPRSDEPVTGRDLRAALDAVLEGKPVPEDQKPSMGCSIKFRPGNEPDYM